jgi:hypothetical protein
MLSVNGGKIRQGVTETFGVTRGLTEIDEQDVGGGGMGEP